MGTYCSTVWDQTVEKGVSGNQGKTVERSLLGKTFGCCRFLYNQMLNDKIREYEKTKKMLKIHRPCIKRNIHF